MVGDYEAEDLTQEVFIKVSQSLGDFRSESQLSTWIYRIASNAAIDRLRSRPYRAESGSVALVDASDIDTADNAAEERPDRALIRKEMNECISGLIDTLPEDYRIVIMLSEIGGFQNREIADRLCISIENVKIRLHRARKHLKELMERSCTLYRDDRNELACDRKIISLKFR
jgi:RNA polymerase sigma-70 factor (ECF subfamily)